MTQEEKARAYDEAYKKVAVRFGSNVADEIFPELKESEDEMVRKALINGFNKLDKSAVWYNGITNGQILAWLEKQGEQKPADTEKGAKGNDREISNSAWSEEDEKRFFWIIEHFSQSGELYSNLIAWLKSLKDRVLPQPKQEWREEDEKTFSLVLNNLYMLLDNAKGCSPDWVFYLTKAIQFIKSLKERYTWKPSEEMLEALYRAVPDNVKEMSEDEMLLDKLYQGLKYGRVLNEK